jgi:3-phosphoshikimate 1-carboxyvinyltransferase
MRMFPPIAALFPAEGRIFGKGSLLKRKVGMMEAPLRALGASCSTKNGKPPITVRGPLHSGSITIDGSESSQFLTGLLLALTICKGNSVIRVGNLKSKPYVRMTVSLQRKFGVRIKSDSRLSRFAIPGSQNYRAHSLSIEGDWSGAAFLLVAGAIAGKVHVSGLTRKSSQADKAVLSALKSAGAKVKVGKDSVIVSSAPLQAFKFNASDCPDLFPPLAVLACNCEGTSVISGAKRLAGKESDRAAALQAELGKMGAKLRVKGDLMFIKGRMSNRRGPHKGAARTSPLPLRGGTVDSHNDHRIAMACAIAALNSQKGVRISGEKCVSKSYPQFFRDLKSLQVYR